MAERFTRSLPNQGIPEECSVLVPQAWTARSVPRLHCAHQRFAWIVAPRMESNNEPPIPPTMAVHIAAAGHDSRNAITAMNTAPISPAPSPRVVIPPDVPAGTVFHVTIERGAAADDIPASVAHVSAVAAAIAPAPATFQMAAGHSTLAIASNANTPPFAITCHASRRPVFSTMSRAESDFAAGLTRERNVELRKKANSIASHVQPATAHAAPTASAARVPLPVRDQILTCAKIAISFSAAGHRR